MKIAAKTAVMRDRPVFAPRAPNTVPDAPAPKPAPASAPLPRCSNTSTTTEIVERTCTTVRIVNNIFVTLKSGARCGDDREVFVGLERGAADQTAIHVRHREELRGIRSLDAATVLDAHEGRDLSIATRDPGADVFMHFLGLLRRRGPARADRPDRFVRDHGARES